MVLFLIIVGLIIAVGGFATGFVAGREKGYLRGLAKGTEAIEAQDKTIIQLSEELTYYKYLSEPTHGGTQ